MVIKKYSTRAGVATGALLLALLSFTVRGHQPVLLFENGKVWVKGIEPEVLFTFSRYFNTQKDWESVFPVTLKENIYGVVIDGVYEVFDESLSFTPRFPFLPRVEYLAKFFADQLAHNTNEVYLPTMDATVLSLAFSPLASTQIASNVTAVFPSANVLPENLLKFHICFSKSMTVGNAYAKIKLMDSAGKEIQKPFLVVDQELWDEEMKTLTILLDPGRIKRGLRPNLEMKPALQEGNSYTLIVEKGWRDVDGSQTQQNFSKTFTCMSADRTSPDVASYTINAPQSERSPLVVDLKEPIDFIMLSRVMRVKDTMGNIVEGALYPQKNETEIMFVPKYPWSHTQYTIEFNPLLEDLAGNNLNRLFDEDLTSVKSHDRPSNLLSFKVSKISR